MEKTYKLPELGYDYNVLEPFIDEMTMKIHHTKHHQGYVDKLNAALEGHSKLRKLDIEELLRNIKEVPEDIRQAVINNGGGHFNHSFFWPLLKGDVPFEGEAAEAIKENFGSLDAFKDEFKKAALGRFGSGWAWLGFDEKGKLHIGSSSNQDSPVMHGHFPILGLDVWEHAYYLKYQNRRPDYVDAFFNIINWEQVNTNFREGMKRF